MSTKQRTPETAATRWLRSHGLPFVGHLYDYVEHGGTRESSQQLGVDEHVVVKTLVMEDDKKQPLLVLMHGDLVVSTKELARQAGRRTVEPCKPEVAHRHSGYLVGGTSPFGTKKPMPVFFEASISGLERMFINGGQRGFLVELAPAPALAVLAAKPVSVGIAR